LLSQKSNFDPKKLISRNDLNENSSSQWRNWKFLSTNKKLAIDSSQVRRHCRPLKRALTRKYQGDSA
jgi:hypothetical protein